MPVLSSGTNAVLEKIQPSKYAALEEYLGLYAGPYAASAAPGQITVVAFDEQMHAAGNTATDVSSPALNGKLTTLDRLAIEVVVDNVTAAVGPVSFTAQLEHSGDNLHWMKKGASPEIAEPDAISLTGATYMEIGYDDGARPTLGFARLALKLSAVSGPVSAHVKINVTCTDLRARVFLEEMEERQGAFAESGYSSCYPAGSRVEAWGLTKLLPFLWYMYKAAPALTSLNGKTTLLLTVPAGTMLCFNALKDYILVDHGKVVWSSLVAEEAEKPKQDPKGPKVEASDPKVGGTIKPSGGSGKKP